MNFPRTAVSEWFWAAGPFRRFLASLAVTGIVVVVPYLAGWPPRGSLIAMLIGWDLGSWFMDRLYLDRLTHGKIVAG
jgi:hypothetical protein